MKTIDTLIEDIEALLVEGKEDISDEILDKFGKAVAQTMKKALVKQPGGTLRMSNIGKPCERALYYEINFTDQGEPFNASTLFKFLIGHLGEEALLFLAEVAGHKVEGRQDTQEIMGVKGHRDAVIDGVTTDAKSASSYSFQKFKNHTLVDDDAFGYIPQLQGYTHSGQNDPIVTDKTRGAFLVFDKSSGHLCLDIHPYIEKDWDGYFNDKINMVQSPVMPERGFKEEPEGKSGNMKLGVNCSYCNFKSTCWPKLRTFQYSNKPVFLTKVVREPKVWEIK